ncbi:hypothetical protein BMS3Abin14_00928 [bacterium BMS3Abin14]|nr:hypothetical protein BMS3Abin14_00928 [bacterium BMS3Abin14]
MMDAEKKERDDTTEDTEKSQGNAAEGLLKEFWGKVVEYASLGAEEASKVSSTAKMRVDIETLKFKRGKLSKVLGERYFDEWLKDSSLAVKETRDLLRQIKGVDQELKKLEKESAGKGGKTRAGKKTKSAPARKKPAAPKKTSGKKTAKKAAVGKKEPTPPQP